MSNGSPSAIVHPVLPPTPRENTGALTGDALRAITLLGLIALDAMETYSLTPWCDPELCKWLREPFVTSLVLTLSVSLAIGLFLRRTSLRLVATGAAAGLSMFLACRYAVCIFSIWDYSLYDFCGPGFKDELARIPTGFAWVAIGAVVAPTFLCWRDTARLTTTVDRLSSLPLTRPAFAVLTIARTGLSLLWLLVLGGSGISILAGGSASLVESGVFTLASLMALLLAIGTWLPWLGWRFLSIGAGFLAGAVGVFLASPGWNLGFGAGLLAALVAAYVEDKHLGGMPRIPQYRQSPSDDEAIETSGWDEAQ